MNAPGQTALVLAAGNGDRFRNFTRQSKLLQPVRESKLLQPVLGRPLIIRTLDTARATGIAACEIVLGITSIAGRRARPSNESASRCRSPS